MKGKALHFRKSEINTWLTEKGDKLAAKKDSKSAVLVSFMHSL
jgi:hypothetical protein